MLIAIEGCLGAGKTTIAEGLAAHRGVPVLLEDFEANPFLQAFYADPIRNTIETEFAFLLLHFHQLKPHPDAAYHSEVVADFHLGKDLIYADLNLKDAVAAHLFRGLYEYCSLKTPCPALLIFLSGSTDFMIDRIRQRNREFERQISRNYLEAVNNAYEEFFERYSGRKLRLFVNEWDFVEEPALYSRLSTLVDEELNVG